MSHLQDGPAKAQHVDQNRHGTLSQECLPRGALPLGEVLEGPHSGGPVPLLWGDQLSNKDAHAPDLNEVGLARGVPFRQRLQRPSSLCLQSQNFPWGSMAQNINIFL